MSGVFEKRGDAAVLRAEVEGLATIEATRTIRVPRVIDFNEAAGLLVLERLEFAPANTGFGQRFGRALASLHAYPCHEPYGWTTSNFIGATPQVNTPRTTDWVAFWSAARLMPMLSRLGASGELHDAVSAVIDTMPALFEDGHVPHACLIHGDLWSGNWGMLRDGIPVIFDPCVSYSDSEADLAMMELFSAPPAGFRQGYGQPARGYTRRKRLYQLYHLLNHAVLFGGGYAAQALACARALVRV